MKNARIGQILSRVIVPAWVLTGAVFKFMEATPRNLPGKTILTLADRFSLDLNWTLAVLIGLEFMAVAVMLCLARLARPMALFVLSVFCLVLIGEMAPPPGQFQARDESASARHAECRKAASETASASSTDAGKRQVRLSTEVF